MWIGSSPHLIDRRRLVSPPGYQSPALGDSVPIPGLQNTHHVTPQPGVTTSTLSRVPRLFASAVSQARTRREVESEPRISHGPIWSCIETLKKDASWGIAWTSPWLRWGSRFLERFVQEINRFTMAGGREESRTVAWVIVFLSCGIRTRQTGGRVEGQTLEFWNFLKSTSQSQILQWFSMPAEHCSHSTTQHCDRCSNDPKYDEQIQSTIDHQQNSKIVSGFCQFCQFFWFLETWKGNFLEKSQYFVRYRSGLG